MKDEHVSTISSRSDAPGACLPPKCVCGICFLRRVDSNVGVLRETSDVVLVAVPTESLKDPLHNV